MQLILKKKKDKFHNHLISKHVFSDIPFIFQTFKQRCFKMAILKKLSSRKSMIKQNNEIYLKMKVAKSRKNTVKVLSKNIY